MTLAELCLLGAIVLTVLSIVPAKLDGAREYNNGNPRDPGFYTPGLRSRSRGAHLNGYEAFPFFAAAVLLAEMRGVSQGTIDGLAGGFVLARMGYVLLYLADRPTGRTVAWFAGVACNLAIFFSPVWAGR